MHINYFDAINKCDIKHNVTWKSRKPNKCTKILNETNHTFNHITKIVFTQGHITILLKSKQRRNEYYTSLIVTYELEAHNIIYIILFPSYF